MDPQQRLMLEIVVGGPGTCRVFACDVARSQTGVFVGVAANEYSQLLSANLGRTPWKPISSPAMRSMSSRVG